MVKISLIETKCSPSISLDAVAKLQPQMFELMFQQVNESMIVASADLTLAKTKILFVNSAFTQLTGYTAAEAIGQGLDILQGARTDPNTLNQLWQRLQQGEACTREIMNYSKDGAEFCLEWQVTPIRNETGCITYFFIILRNITERKQADQVLQQALEKLEELNRLKDDFLSTVSHELRTPIANMKMAIRMLKAAINLEAKGKSYLPSITVQNKVYQYLQILEDECQRESNLINDLLDLQKLESEAWSSNLEIIELQTWLPELVKPFKQRLYERQQSLQLEIPAQLPVLVSDRISLGRILSELLNNACKYTPSGEHIKLVAKTDLKGLQLQIINTGTEIPAQELSKIFAKFYRVPRVDCWKEGGTGLGLALAKKLIESLSGIIQVESAANQTCFTITLPFKPFCAINACQLELPIAG